MLGLCLGIFVLVEVLVWEWDVLYRKFFVSLLDLFIIIGLFEMLVFIFNGINFFEGWFESIIGVVGRWDGDFIWRRLSIVIVEFFWGLFMDVILMCCMVWVMVVFCVLFFCLIVLVRMRDLDVILVGFFFLKVVLEMVCKRGFVDVVMWSFVNFFLVSLGEFGKGWVR